MQQRAFCALLAFHAVWLSCSMDTELPFTTEEGITLVPKLDWEALIQEGQGAGRMLSVNGDAKFGGLELSEGVRVLKDVQAGGKGLFGGDVVIGGKMLEHGGHQFVLGTSDGLAQGVKRRNRALLHSENDTLHLNFDGDFEGGVVVGGKVTTLEGNLKVKSKIIAMGGLDIQGVDDVTFGSSVKKGQKVLNRALSHQQAAGLLVLNKGGGFAGGTSVDGQGLFSTSIVIGDNKAQETQADLHIVSKNVSSIVFSNSEHTSNSVYVKAQNFKDGEGVDMLIGSTGETGGLTVDFNGDIEFKGLGETTFRRGTTLFASGRVGIGAKAHNWEHALTIATGAKAGDPSNDIAVPLGSVHVFGGLYDMSSKEKWYLDLDKGGDIKALNIATKLGVGTTEPKSQFTDNNGGLLHIVDKARPTLTLESKAAKGRATIVMQTATSEVLLDANDEGLNFITGKKDRKTALSLNAKGKVGFGRPNDSIYGIYIQMGNADEDTLNDLALPLGSIRIKGKIYDTFDGGDKFYLDPSQVSNIRDITLEGKLSFKGVTDPKYHIELPTNGHVSMGKSLFINGESNSGSISSNAVTHESGSLALHDQTKLASSIKLLNKGSIELSATEQAGSTNFNVLFGVDGPSSSAYAMARFGVGTKTPEHAFHMVGDGATMSLGNNLFLAGSNDVNRITANAYVKGGAWVVPHTEKLSSSIELKDSGKVEMYGTQTQGSQWKKMFGFSAPDETVYAFGKLGINTENPSHTLSIPSGDNHISLGNHLFLNGQGAKSRIMGNAFYRQGQVVVEDKSRQGINIELDSAAGTVDFGGTLAPGSSEFLKLLSLDFTEKSVNVASGRLGVKTDKPKTSLDVRGHLNLEDSSNAGVIYTPSTGSGLYIRAADSPGKYSPDSERYFFGNNYRAGFGTNRPSGKLHLVHTSSDTELPHLKLETEGEIEYTLHGMKEGLVIGTPNSKKSFIFKSGDTRTFEVFGDGSESSQNDHSYKNTIVALAPSGGRVVIGGTAQSQHALQVFGTGTMLTGTSIPGTGVVAFGPDGGGKGFQMDYHNGNMIFSSLPPTKHLRITDPQKVYMVFSDKGNVGVGTNTPMTAFHVKADSGITVENSKGATWTYKTSINGHLEFQNNKGGYLKFNEKGGLHLTNNLGEAKSSDYKLEVSGKGMMLQGDGDGKAPMVFGADGGGKGFSMDYYKEKMMFGHADGSKWHMTMTDNGMMGVGTPSPTSALHVKHDSGIAIEHGSKSQRWSLKTHDNANLDFAYMGKTLISYTPNGFVGIGTADPKKLLHVEGDVYVAGKMHVDNWYTMKAGRGLVAAPKLLQSAEALIQLDEHVSAKMEDDTIGMIYSDSEKAATPVDMTTLMTVMHRVLQSHQAEIRDLKRRLEAVEAKS